MSGKKSLVEIVKKETMRFEELRDLIEGLRLENLTAEQQNEIIKLFQNKFFGGNTSHQSQVAGIQNQLIAQNQLVFNKESFSGMFKDIVESLKENFGEQVGAEILKELIRTAIAKL